MFAYPNAKFEAIGNPYTIEKELNSIVESKDLSEFKDTLNSLRDYNVTVEDTYSIQKSLDENFLQTIDMMRKDSSKKMNDFYDIYLERIDIYLIKNELKKIFLGKTEEVDIEGAILPKTEEFFIKLKESGKENLPDLLKKYGFTNELIEAISKEPINPLKIDVNIDRYIIDKLKQVEVPYKCEKAKQNYIKRIVDVSNIKNVLRAKQLGYDVNTCKILYLGEGREIAPWKFNEISELEQPPQIISSLEGTSYFNVLKDAIEQYNSENSVQVLENVLDGYFLKIIRDISIQHYLNLGPTLRFLVSKEFEIKNLKVIAKGIGESLSSDIIKRYLITEVG
jgi:V/A-type H+-transporting ATPase subunit C